MERPVQGLALPICQTHQIVFNIFTCALKHQTFIYVYYSSSNQIYVTWALNVHWNNWRYYLVHFVGHITSCFFPWKVRFYINTVNTNGALCPSFDLQSDLCSTYQLMSTPLSFYQSFVYLRECLSSVNAQSPHHLSGQVLCRTCKRMWENSQWLSKYHWFKRIFLEKKFNSTLYKR